MERTRILQFGSELAERGLLVIPSVHKVYSCLCSHRDQLSNVLLRRAWIDSNKTISQAFKASLPNKYLETTKSNYYEFRLLSDWDTRAQELYQRSRS